MLVRIPKAKLQHLSSAILALLLLSYSSFIAAQTLHRFGQSIQPIYEGFERNDDGTFTMWFGYLNRNYDETPNIEIGGSNAFYIASGVNDAGPLNEDLILSNPGSQDRGQPTYFYPRRQQFVVDVNLPADFVGNELVWSITHNGETRTAVGTLQRENIWAVDEGVWSANRGRGTGGRTEIEYENEPPSLRLVGIEGSISISGNLMAVGATGEDSNQVTITNGSTASSNNDTSNSGAVYIFERTGTSWAQVAYIKAPNPDVDDYFGRSVSLDNKTLLVTSRDDSNQTTITNGTTASSDNSNTDSGAAYVFVLQ